MITLQSLNTNLDFIDQLIAMAKKKLRNKKLFDYEIHKFEKDIKDLEKLKEELEEDYLRQ